MMQKRKKSFEVHHDTVNGAPNSEDSAVAAVATNSCLTWRYYIAFLGFASLFMINFQRMAMAVAIVKMTNFTSKVTTKLNSTMSSCPVSHNATIYSSVIQGGGDFDWSPQLQGFILGTYFLGFAITPAFAGRMSEKFGAKGVAFFANVVSAVAMLLSSVFSWWNVYALIFLQIVRGISHGFILSAMYVIMSNWATQKEKGFISGFIITGFYVGSMAGGLVGGFICQNTSLGWPAVYYILGAVGILFSIVFGLTFYETPKDHPRITSEELKYITEGLAKSKKEDIPPTPWVGMFSSASTYGLAFGLFAYLWKVFYFVSVHPTYLKTILHYSISESGFIAAMPFIGKIIASLFASAFADWLYRRSYVGVDKLRKGCAFLGCLGFALSMLGVYLAKCNEVLNIVFFTTALISAGASTPGAMITAVDMSPNFAATLMGVMMTFASSSGFILPVVVGYMTEEQTLESWQNVFILNIVLMMVCGTVFAVFGSAEIQPWNFSADEHAKIASNNMKREDSQKVSGNLKTQHIATVSGELQKQCTPTNSRDFHLATFRKISMGENI